MQYRTKGVCARTIDVELEGNVVKNVVFFGGCDGNLKAIPKLVKGMTVEQVCQKLEGNTCGPRSTSCADQMCKALRQALAEQQ